MLRSKKRLLATILFAGLAIAGASVWVVSKKVMPLASMDIIVADTPFSFVKLPAGSFRMGQKSDYGRQDAVPLHRVMVFPQPWDQLKSSGLG